MSTDDVVLQRFTQFPFDTAPSTMSYRRLGCTQTTSFEAETATLMSELDAEPLGPPTFLPWGALRERHYFPEVIHISPNAKPGEFVLQTLFAEFCTMAEKKINTVLDVPNREKPLSKLLTRGEDANFDQLLSSLGSVTENCLPSLLRVLFEWYDRQSPTDVHRQGYRSWSDKEHLCERRDLAVDFIYCLVLIEILKMLSYHPGHDELISHIINQAFKHFKYKEGTQTSPNAANMNVISDLYAEVITEVAKSRFLPVRKKFLTELKELRGKDQNPFIIHSVISLLMGMKFFRVKMHPMEEFQACVQLLHDLGLYFLEVKDRDIKHALAGLFVEILLPVAAVVKNEVNVPVLKNFVEMMYTPTLDLMAKKKHTLPLFPMVTCLLCVGQKQFFLQNWPSFLTQCLSRLRDKDQKIARVALEALYRLLWVYVIRIKCESNTNTTSRLQSIVSSLFPKGSKLVMPRDAPISIFVKIIQFISQERLDFAMKEIIYDLLCAGKQTKAFYSPERMSIGLRAFLVVADGLQQKEGEPPMPQTMGVLPSGNTLRFKKTFINKYLSEDMARSIGMAYYYSNVRKAFDAILKYLDSQVGKPMMMTRNENINREPEEIITGAQKPKIDLFRTCVAAVPRLLPDGMTQQDLIDLFSRLTVHMDGELGKLAFQSLQNIVVDLPAWRNDVLHGFVQFIQREVSDSFPHQLDQCNRRLITLCNMWKTSAQATQNAKEKAERADHSNIHDKNGKNDPNAELSTQGIHLYSHEQIGNRNTLHTLEGFALVMLCSSKPIIKKLAVVLLKEVRNLFTVLNIPKASGDPCVLDVMDKACSLIVEKVLPHLPMPEKTAALSASVVDFQWLADRTSVIWSSGSTYHTLTELTEHTNNPGLLADLFSSYDPWMESMSIFMGPDYVMGNCSTAVSHAWPILYTRLHALYVHVDPLTAMNESRTSSILRKKVTTERDMYQSLWKNYVTMGCCIAPPSQVMFEQRSVSPELNTSSPDTPEKLDLHPPSPGMTARELFKTIVPLIRFDPSDMRERVVSGLGHINPAAFSDLVEELFPLIKEAIERKAENVRRKKRRDVLRLALVRIFRSQALNGIFVQSPADVIDPVSDALCQTFVEYIDGARLFLESEGDKDSQILQDIKLHFSEFMRHLIRSTPVSKRHKLLSPTLRSKLSDLFSNWSGPFSFNTNRDRSKISELSELEFCSLQALCSVLCCGPIYDQTLLNDDGSIYAWLDILLSDHDDKIKGQIYQLAQETIVLLLEFNCDAQALLDWVIDRCYTGPPEVSDGCFNALAMVFNNREYPCDLHAMLNVTLLHTSSPRKAIHETAVQLLHLLYKRFFLDDVIVDGEAPPGDDKESVFLRHTSERIDKHELEDMLLSGPYSRSQLFLSETLAQLHVELTMPMFSEITHRFQTGTFPVRQALVQYLLPWLHNMELTDPNLSTSQLLGNLLTLKEVSDYPKPPLKGDGWGSPQATEMVLNNLLFITVKFGDEHAKEIEDLWTALVSCWPANLPIIIRYIVIVVGIAPNTLLEHAKRVVLYLGRARPDRLIDELMNELRTIEPLNFNVERTETPPYYRLTSLKKQQTNTSSDDTHGDTQESILILNKGQIHTKRHSAEDPGKLAAADSPLRTASTSSLRSEGSSISSIATSRLPNEGEDEQPVKFTGSLETKRIDSPIPFPLPMPAFGGYFAPLSDMLPDTNLPNPPYQRCNLAVMLLADLVLDTLEVDWTVHLPLMLHISFLGLDHSRQLIHEHCKRLLLNVLLVLSAHNDHFTVAKTIIGNKCINDNTALTMPNTTGKDYAFLEGSCDSAVSTVVHTPTSVNTLSTDSVDSLADVTSYETTEQVAKALIEFLVTRKSGPLWSYEDITSKVHNIRSAEQLEHFLCYVLRVFIESLPLAHIEQRWAQESLHLALSCSSRHYAGRSFQVFRALHAPLTSTDLSEILSRLVETVAEQGEDMQGYVTEIMLTLNASVDNLDVEMKPLMKEIFLSTPNLNKESRVEMRRSITGVPLRQQGPGLPYSHIRSTSYNLSVYARRAVISAPIMENKALPPGVETRHHRHSSGDNEPSGSGSATRRSTNLSRSRSAQSLKHIQDSLGHDDKITILSQMFWIAVSMLESDYEYEFLLAIRLLDKILQHLQPDRPECKEKLDKILQQICWSSFPGVHALLLKGCTSPVTAEPTWALVSRLSRCISAPVVDPSQCEGFPMNVIAMLPYLVEHYEDPNRLCIEGANNIAQMCQEMSSKLDNLATVMNLYSHKTFTKDSFQWTKCVVKYLYDVYSSMHESLIAFLIEVLERGPTSYQASILKILHCIVHYVDLTNSPSQSVNSDLLRVVAKYIENTNWREAHKILKLCVARSSTLSAPPPSIITMSSLMDTSGIGLSAHTSFAEAEISFKKELPGRTMDFQFDQSQITIIGSKLLNLSSPDGEGEGGVGTAERRSAAEGASLSPGASVSESSSSGWKRPQLSQGRTRARFVNLLNCYGPRIMMPKSPSVIFSHDSPSDTLERQASTTCSSSEEVSLADGISGDMKLGDDSSGEQPLQILDSAFDFLDDQDSTCDFFGVKRHSMTMDEQQDLMSKGEQRYESSDEETQSASPMDEYRSDLAMATCPTITYNNPISLDMHKRSSGSISGQSMHSTSSEVDTTPGDTDFSPPCISPLPTMMAIQSPTASSDDLEDVWRSHVNKVMTDMSGSHAVNTFHLFARLFQDIKNKLSDLTQEVCLLLRRPQNIRDLALQLAGMLDLMTHEIQCPLVFVDVSTLLSCRMLEKLSFSLLEIQESFETYLMRREQTIENIDAMRMSETEVGEEEKLQLCRNLYRLYFQLQQLFEGYSKLIRHLARASQRVEVTDLTRDVLDLKDDLSKAALDMEHGQSSVPFQIDIHTMTQMDAERLIIDFLVGKNYIMALHHVQNLRKVFPMDILGLHLSDDIEALLYIYCQHQAELKPGILAICQPEHDMSEICCRLMDFQVQISQAIAQVQSETRFYPGEQVHVRTPDSSTL